MSELAHPKPVPEPKSPPKRIARNKRPAKKRKTSLAALKRKLWCLFAAYVRQRDTAQYGGVCVTCRDEVGDQAGHFYSRRIASTWVDPKNVVLQGPKCNLFMQGNPGAFAEHILREYGAAELERLTLRANRVTKVWRADEVRKLIDAIRVSGEAFEMAYYENNL